MCALIFSTQLIHGECEIIKTIFWIFHQIMTMTSFSLFILWHFADFWFAGYRKLHLQQPGRLQLQKKAFDCISTKILLIDEGLHLFQMMDVYNINIINDYNRIGSI